MKVRAQIDRHIPLSEENLRVCIADGSNKPLEMTLDELRSIMHTMSNIFDYRLEGLNRIFLEDSKFLVNLSEDQQKKFFQAFEALYPVKGGEVPRTLNPKVWLQFSKPVSQGETYLIELSDIAESEDLELVVIHALDILDSRMFASNIQELDHSALLKSYPFEDQMLLQKIFDVLFGRVAPDRVAAQLHSLSGAKDGS